MTIKRTIRSIALALMLLASGLLIDLAPIPALPNPLSAKDAHARVGRPATPVSYAGTARRSSRRTTRRVIRRTSVYRATLPGGCTQMTVSGALVHSCGGTYYQPSGNQYVQVNIE